MANYSVDTFVRIPLPGEKLDPAIKIYNINGKHVFSIEPYITTFTQKNSYVYIIADNTIIYQNTLDFSSADEAKDAVAKLNEIKKIYLDTYSDKNPDYYTKAESDARFVPLDQTYTKQEVDENFYKKPELNDGKSFLNLSGLTLGGIDVYDVLTHIETGATQTTYTGDAQITIGGINQGESFTGTSMQDMWFKLLHPYQYPTTTLNSNIPTLLEVGGAINANYNFNWNSTNVTNIQTNSFSLTGPFVNLTNQNYSGTTSVNIINLSSATAATVTWNIQGVNTQSQTFSNYVYASWAFKRFYGTNANTTLTNSDIQLLSSEFSNTRLKTWSQNGNGQYIYYVYPVVFGDNDPNPPFIVGGLPNSAWVRTTQTITLSTGLQVSYYIYRTITIQNGSGITLQKL